MVDAHPALGDTITEAAVAGEFEREDLPAFERSILNVWPRPRQLGAAINLDTSAGLADLDTPAQAVALAFDVATDRGNRWMVQAGRTPGGGDGGRGRGLPAGAGWLADEVRAWRRAHPFGVIVADSLAAGTIADRLELAGVDVLRTGPGQMARACADLVDQVAGRSIAHRDQAVLDDVLAAPAGGCWATGRAWSRRHSDADISPLVAATLAASAARTHPSPPAPFVKVAPR